MQIGSKFDMGREETNFDDGTRKVALQFNFSDTFHDFRLSIVQENVHQTFQSRT